MKRVTWLLFAQSIGSVRSLRPPYHIRRPITSPGSVTFVRVERGFLGCASERSDGSESYACPRAATQLEFRVRSDRSRSRCAIYHGI